MAFVIDASVTACWAFDDEDHPDARLAFSRLRAEEAVIPGLWELEIRNILLVNERRGRISESDSAVFLRALSKLRLRVDDTPDYEMVLRLARKHRLSAYDAAYLELATRTGLPVATLDGALRTAARAEGTRLVSAGEES
jgi:predicted nucleic acid-binding protein